jgi:hypothetical protein
MIFFRRPAVVVARLLVSSGKTVSFEIVRELCAQAGGSAALRRQMIDTGIVKKMDAPMLESWMRPAVGFDSIDPIAKTARLIASTGSLLPLHWLCGQAGVFFVPGQQAFSPILGKGSQTWFAVSLQVHELRQTVIRAFLDSPEGKPVIDEQEGRLIARCWATVFGWIEGFLEVHREGLADPPSEESRPLAKLHPVLFRTTTPWQVLSEAFAAKGCPSRSSITEVVAHPFGAAVQNAKGDWCFPNENTLDKWTERRATDMPPGTGTRGPLDYTLALCYGTQSLAPLQWLARQSGGTIVSPPKAATPAATDDDLLRFWERTMVELAELDASIARALLDQKIDKTEVARLRSEWADVVTWMRSFVSAW